MTTQTNRAAATMRAIQQREWGGPEVLEYVEITVPEPADDEILIRVTRSAVNFDDAWTGATGFSRFTGRVGELPAVPGGEIVGVRVDTGARVMALCRGGGYAQYAVAPAHTVYEIPDNIDDDVALGLLVPGLTAWFLRRACGTVTSEHTVAVHAAGGAVGSITVQLLANAGIGKVIGIASTDAKRAYAKAVGADEVIDPEPVGLAKRITEANGGGPVDVILEMAGGKIFEESLAALAPLGRLIVYGAATGEASPVDARELIIGSKSVTGLWLMDHVQHRDSSVQALTELFTLVAAGKLRPPSTRVYPLSDVALAQKDVATRGSNGRALLDPFAG
ncbi:quinone oxidoreductase family protein [Streptomyces sp. NPDC054919]